VTSSWFFIPSTKLTAWKESLKTNLLNNFSTARREAGRTTHLEEQIQSWILQSEIWRNH